MESVCSCNYCSTLYLFLSYFSSTKNIYVCASPFSLNLFISPIRSSYCMLATTEPSNSPMETGIVYSSLCPSVLLLLFAVVAFQSLFAIVFSSSVYTISCVSFLNTIPILFSFHLLVLLLLHPLTTELSSHSSPSYSIMLHAVEENKKAEHIQSPIFSVK